MVFSSLPLYLDPHNWQQTQNHHQQGGGGGGGGGENSQQPQVLPQPPGGGLQVGGAVGTPGSIRPGSMADRARLAKLPQPEPGLKCPRCESTNTKFCYFNNYNLSQPRHFCKTCRRYWTRGGALRNVPVGGGCRRNKRSKSTSSGTSKSPINTNANSNTTSTTTTTTTPSNCSSDMMMSSHFAQQPPQLSLMAASSLQNLTSHYGGGGAADIGLNFGGIQPHMEQSELGFQLGSNYSSGTGGIGSDNHHQWRISSQHFPFMGGNSSFEPSAGVTTTTNFYPFQNEGNVETGRGGGGPSMKMEDSNQLGLNLTKPILGNISETSQYWGGTGNMWPTDFSGGLNSSSTSHLL